MKDLIAARVETGASLLFEVSDVAVDELGSGRPRISFTHDGAQHELECDVIAGCDGFHGICRPAIPAGVLRTYERDYPYGWLGILAAVAPSNDELIYASHERGFALLSLRSPELSRLYIQCRPDEDLGAWPDDRIWQELHARLGLGGWTLAEGPVLEKGVTGMRSFVTEPMQHGRLFLAGDAAHIVPPTGAKGLNLAIADVALLAEALIEWYATGDRTGLDGYSQACLRRVWRAEHFSYWMTSMLHRDDEAGEFGRRLQLSQLRYVTTSTAAAASLAENYVGLARGLSPRLLGERVGLQRHDNRAEPPAARRQPVLDPRWARVHDHALEHARGLELCEPARERGRRNRAEHLDELVEPHRALVRGDQDRHRPATLEEARRAADLLGKRRAATTPHGWRPPGEKARARGRAPRRASSPGGTSAPRGPRRECRRGRRGCARG